MQYIEIKIRNMKFENLGGGDPIKQMEERTKALEEIRKKTDEQMKSGSYTYSQDWNPFPKWLREIIKELAEENKAALRYDDENHVFKLNINGSRYEYDEFCDTFEARFNEATIADSEAQKWALENKVLKTGTSEDEVLAMEDLKTHHGDKSKPTESEAE